MRCGFGLGSKGDDGINEIVGGVRYIPIIDGIYRRRCFGKFEYMLWKNRNCKDCEGSDDCLTKTMERDEGVENITGE